MGTVISNLKARFGVDTSDFKKGLKDGESAIADFKGAAGDEFDKFASLFGVNMSAVTDALGTANKSLKFLGASFKGAAAGGEVLSIGMKVLRVAIAATGIGALIILLAAVGAYFTKTEKGAKELAGGMAQIKAVTNVLIDRFAKFGEGLWLLTKGQIVLGVDAIKESVIGLGEAAKSAGALAKELAEDTYSLGYATRQYNVYVSEQNILLEALRLKSKDLDLTESERLKALVDAGKIEKKINKDGLAIAADKIVNAQWALSLDKDNIEKKDELAAAYIQYNEQVSKSIVFERMLAREKNTLIKTINNEELALKKEHEQFKSFSNLKLPPMLDPKVYANIQRSLTDLQHTFIQTKESTSALFQVMGTVAVDATTALNSAFEGAAAGLGEFFGALASGNAGVGGFGKMIATTFADLAINVGKIAIGAGLAVLGIKKALMTLNPGAAIAAGVALVALGAAIKGSLANVASGGGSASASSNSSTYDTRAAGSAQTQAIDLKGNVTFTIRGTDLVGVLTNESTRRKVISGEGIGNRFQ